MPEKPPRIFPLALQHWDKRLDQIVEDTVAAPINVHQLMANNPSLLKACWDFRNHAVQGGTLGKSAGELVILRVAVHMQAWYEWASHVDRALACDLTIDEINQVLCYSTGQGWQAADAVLLRAVDDLIARHCLTEQTQIELAQYFSTEQVMDIIAIHGMYVILACMIKSWGLPLDQQVRERIAGQASERDFITAATRFKTTIDNID
ncbi:MAG: carboxymuconolactone decarboxylase family protein [Proteobacteria bacterium]|nr:carboxymuconolactone decarboxylase family protein [Pseudomonadota bacterium]MDA1351626.1 carboxymuconolactone decarboxylase family protein [Pseudomonadota bacterium]